MAFFILGAIVFTKRMQRAHLDFSDDWCKKMCPVLMSVVALNPVQYNYIYPETEDKKVFGLIAQEVHGILQTGSPQLPEDRI